MLAKVQSPPDAKKKAESLNILSLCQNMSLEEHELKIRKSVELNKPIIGLWIISTVKTVTKCEHVISIVATPNSPNISGGSSPSREVQEILSVKEDSENILNDEFYDDNNDLLDENDGDSVEKVDEPEPYYNTMNGEFKRKVC